MRYLLTCIFVLFFSQSIAFATELQGDKNLSQQTNNIKAQVIELNKDLFLLEEDLLHPVSTRLALYVSMDFGRFFTLESVKVKLDGKPVSSFLYTKKDIDALKRGAIQPLYLANIRSGKHELVAVFTGIGTHNVAYKRAVTMNFEKKQGEKSLEIQIVDDPSSQQAQFKIKAWN
ncbi:MAG: AraC family transcriptional regulator [Gammaproteobacteria bacterium]|nr:AraC family transcriptional regulator [Gammaproteobacteria bacterium]